MDACRLRRSTSKPMQRCISSRAFLAAVVSIHALLLGWLSYRQSPTIDEIAYLPAGISHILFGNQELYRANPPLVRMLAAVPVILCNPDVSWSAYDRRPSARPEFFIGQVFAERNRSKIFWFFAVARWVCVPWSSLGIFVSYLWAKELFGQRAGCLASVLWAVCPTMLAHGSLMTPDIASASLGITTLFVFRSWTINARWDGALLLGIVLGLTWLAKTNWLILGPLLPLTWGVYAYCMRLSAKTLLLQSCQLCGAMLISLLIVNACYAFQGSGKKLVSYRFSSKLLRHPDELDLGNRFTGTVLEKLPVPLPEEYVLGVDSQRYSVEAGRLSYLLGEWSQVGWWYYYLVAFVVKMPVGILLLMALTCITAYRHPDRRLPVFDEVLLLLPALSMLIFISSQAGVNRHFRYFIPILPLIYISLCRLVMCPQPETGNSDLFPRRRLQSQLVAGLVAITAASTAFTYPHTLSYFNELAGGPRNGAAYLLGSNVDWGQDLLFVKRWADRHPSAQPLFIANTPLGLAPSLAGIECRPLPRIPVPGWYIISENVLHDQNCPEYIKQCAESGRIGYSMVIFNIP